MPGLSAAGRPDEVGLNRLPLPCGHTAGVCERALAKCSSFNFNFNFGERGSEGRERERSTNMREELDNSPTN